MPESGATGSRPQTLARIACIALNTAREKQRKPARPFAHDELRGTFLARLGWPRWADAGSNRKSAWQPEAANPLIEMKEFGGRGRARTADPLLAKQVLSQLSYTPTGRSRKSRIPWCRQKMQRPPLPMCASAKECRTDRNNRGQIHAPATKKSSTTYDAMKL